MATDKRLTLPSGQQLSSEVVTNLYLYEESTTPSERELLNSDLIKPELDIPEGAEQASDISANLNLVTVEIDASSYMSTGAGRFANGSQFELVEKFFNPNASLLLSPGIYDKLTLRDDLFPLGLDFLGSAIELRNYQDSVNDYDERVYVWNSSVFALPDDVEFVVHPNGAKEIRNFRIEPNRFNALSLKENFDFDTANPFIETGSRLLLESRVDPSSIGRTVFIDFYDRNNLPLYDPVSNGTSSGVYDLEDFNYDIAKEASNFVPASVSVIQPVIREAAKLFNAGVTRFTYQDKPIFYGTVNNDTLTASNLVNAAVQTAETNPRDVNFSNGLVLLGGIGNDSLTGDAFSNIFGGTDDILVGHEGNDSLNGKGGEDLAIFTGNFADYDFTLSADKKTITVDHARGTKADDTDTLRNIEFAQFQDTLEGAENLNIFPLLEDESGNQNIFPESEPETVTRIIPLPLEDGVEETEFVATVDTTVNPNPNDLPTPPSVTLSAPVSMLDGDVDYTLNISPYQPSRERTITYIIDTSHSMLLRGNLQPTKDAYTDLTNYFIDNELDENINFNIVQFSRNATTYSNLSAEQAISTIQSLTTAPGSEGTKYNDGLYQGFISLAQSASSSASESNIAYFVSDGKSQQNFFDPFDVGYHQDAELLRAFANVQAFGINDAPTEPGAVTTGQINFIDSNQGIILSDVSDLSNQLQKSGLAGSVASVNILLDGEIVETVTPDQLEDTPLGLIYEGTIDELDVSIDAENVITAEVVFIPGANLADATVEHIVAVGEGEVVDESGNAIDESGEGSDGDGEGNEDEDPDPFERKRRGGAGNDKITLGYADRGAIGGAGGDKIIGNNRDNILDGGAGDDTILGHGGNDTITTGSGNDQVDGGEGIDTVLYDNVTYLDNSNINLRRAAKTVSYNNTDTLTNIEYIQFSDVRINSQNLLITPTVAINQSIRVTEGTSASFNLELDHPAPVDVELNYSTQDHSATAGEDYTSQSGTVIIPAGETSATIEIATSEDSVFDEETETLFLNLTELTGATFQDSKTELEVIVEIENLEPALNLTGTASDDLLTGGNNHDRLEGKEGNDTLIGGAGRDTLRGDGDHDSLVGGEDNDTLIGFGGNDTIDGGAGSDRLYVAVDNDITLNDTLAVGDGRDSISNIELANLYGREGDNRINARSASSISTLIKGNGGNDNLRGGMKNDTIEGGDGDDTLIGFEGNDTIDGGAGSDRLYVAIDNDITLTDNQVVGDGTDSISDIEFANLYGREGNNRIDARNASNISTVIKGEGGNDTLRGGMKNDTIEGGDGNDTLIGFEGNDTLNGGAGSDRLYVAVENEIMLTDTQVVGDGTDSISNIEFANLYGREGNNRIDARNASNISTVIKGNGGNDTLRGSMKNDIIEGGDGDDTLIGFEGNDTLNGGAGSDRLYVAVDNDITLNDTLAVGDGRDSISNIEFANLYGREGDNRINARSASMISTVIKGYEGNDNLRGGMKNDTIEGGDGDDTLIGFEGNDTIDGGAGSDRLYVAVDNEIILTDTQVVGDGTDSISNIEFANLYGREGNNRIDARNASNISTVIKGNGGNDTLRGGMKNDIIEGGDGDDTLIGFAGDDTLNGGSGSDRLYIAVDNEIVLTNTQVTGDGTDSISNIEFANLYGRAGDNLIDATQASNISTVIKGDAGNDTLMGSQMSDQIQGGSGNDFLEGGDGDDTLTGNDGVDVFVLQSAAGTDMIKDFKDGIDLFGLSNSLGFDDLSITNQQDGTAALIVDTSNNNQLLAVVNNFSAADLTTEDFVNL